MTGSPLSYMEGPLGCRWALLQLLLCHAGIHTVRQHMATACPTEATGPNNQRKCIDSRNYTEVTEHLKPSPDQLSKRKMGPKICSPERCSRGEGNTGAAQQATSNYPSEVPVLLERYKGTWCLGNLTQGKEPYLRTPKNIFRSKVGI